MKNELIDEFSDGLCTPFQEFSIEIFYDHLNAILKIRAENKKIEPHFSNHLLEILTRADAFNDAVAIFGSSDAHKICVDYKISLRNKIYEIIKKSK